MGRMKEKRRWKRPRRQRGFVRVARMNERQDTCATTAKVGQFKTVARAPDADPYVRKAKLRDSAHGPLTSCWKSMRRRTPGMRGCRVVDLAARPRRLAAGLLGRQRARMEVVGIDLLPVDPSTGAYRCRRRE